MKTEIPFLEELRSDLLEHPPIDVRASRAAARRSRGPLVAVAAFALVIVVGGMAWILRGDRVLDDGDVGGPDLIEWDLRVIVEPTDDPGGFIADVEAIPGVVDVQYVPDLSVLIPEDPSPSDVVTTTRPPDPNAPDTMEPGGDHPAGLLLVRLDELADPVAIGARLEDLTGGRVDYSAKVVAALEAGYVAVLSADAEMIGGDPLLLRPAQGPEPQFDPSTLGRQVPLLEPPSIDDLVIRLEQPGSIGDPDGMRDETRPVFYIGWVAELESHLVLYPTVGRGYCDVTLKESGRGAGCGGITGTYFGIAGGGSPPGHVRATVPLETSVVVVTGEDGEPLWQRPIGGWGMFPMRNYDYAPVRVDAYDSGGNLIGSWETTL